MPYAGDTEENPTGLSFMGLVVMWARKSIQGQMQTVYSAVCRNTVLKRSEGTFWKKWHGSSMPRITELGWGDREMCNGLEG